MAVDFLRRVLEFYSLKLPYHPGKWRVVEWFIRASGLAASDAGHAFAVERQGLRWKLTPDRDVEHTLYYHGCIDRFESPLLLEHTGPGKVFLDVGSYFGYYALMAAKRGARAIAFEPMPGNFELLRTHADLNALPQLEIVPSAVGAEAGRVRFELPEAGNLGRGHIVPGAADPVGSIEVALVALDSFLAERGITQVDAMKIDVEGAELGVLDGGKEMLARCRPVILIEVNAPCLQRFGASSAQLAQKLRDLGYDLFRVDGGQRRPFTDLETGEDYTNVLCLPAVR